MGKPLAILAVEEVAHRLSTSFVRFYLGLAFVSIHSPLRYGVSRFGYAAGRAAIGKARFIWLQFELF